jgi:hypothetical protein
VLADTALSVARTSAAPEATGVALRKLGVLTGDINALAEAPRCWRALKRQSSTLAL